MENATKALIIAASVLIAVLILSIGIYLFKNYSEVSYENEERQADQALVEYNTKFTKYEDKTLTIQDVLTIVNLAKDYNERKSDNTINVTVSGITNVMGKNKDWANELNINTNKYIISNIETYDDKTIKSIAIIKKTN